jgi:hypothetical protein
LYLEKFAAFGSGPIDRLVIEPQFNGEGLPMPLVLLGRNGTGKTNALSIVADGLIELAATHFSDIMPNNSAGGRLFYRVVGGTSVRAGRNGELTALKFKHENEEISYRSKAGQVNLHDVEQLLVGMSDQVRQWPPAGNVKEVFTGGVSVETAFRQGVYAHFPSGRSETPHWDGSALETDESSTFQMNMSDRLRKPIVLSRALDVIKPWIVDVLFDALVDPGSLLGKMDRDDLNQSLRAISEAAVQATLGAPLLAYINRILQIVTGVPDARIVRVGRAHLDKKLQVYNGNSLLLPSLNGFSAGQATLFSIFATILRYGDTWTMQGDPSNISGIVIVDEIDAHIHADLQYEAIPALMRLFPKVQFILTAHSPLLPLGLENAYGEEGVVLVDLPSGHRITGERYAEFLNSFEYFRSTKAFETELASAMTLKQRPTVICEGETDPIYLKRAAEVLGFHGLSEGADFDWIGTTKVNGGPAADGGQDRLFQAAKFLKNNPAFVTRPTVLLFDSDAKNATNDQKGELYIKKLRFNSDNKRCKSGIENLLPEEVFGEEFYDVVERNTADITIVKKLKKKHLCEHVCDPKREKNVFEGFRDDLTQISIALGFGD